MTDKDAMKLALEALETLMIERGSIYEKAITALNARLAQSEQEPTAKYSDIVSDGGLDPRNKFDVQPQRTWVGLTDEEIDYIYVEHAGDGGPTAICEQFAKAYEAKLKDKNT